MRSVRRKWSSVAAIGVVWTGLSVAAAGQDRLQAIRLEYHRGDLTGALSALEGYLKSAPNEVDGLFLKGVVLSDLGRRQEAEAAFQTVVEIDPSLPEAYNNLAVIHAANGDYQQAIDVLKSALGTHPSYHAAFENLSKLYARLASDAYSRALGVRARAEQDIPLVMLRDVERSPDVGGEADQMIPAEPLVATAVAPVDAVPVTTPVVEDDVRAAEEQATDWQTIPVEALEPPLADGAEVVDMADEVTVSATEPDASSLGAELAVAVQSWAEAWSGQDVEGYLSAYAEGFVPSDGQDRSSWERRRRERVAAPRYIRVSVALLGARVDSPTTGSIRFLQSYESDRFSDNVTKVLRMVLETGAWKILEERVETH